MKVGIESVPFYGNLSGIGQYAKRLIEVASSLSEDVDFEIVRSLMPHRKFVPSIAENKHLSYRVIKWFPPIIYHQTYKRTKRAPAYDVLALRKYDAFMFFNFVAYPVRKSTPIILFIHDLSYVHYPQYTSPKNKKYLDTFVGPSTKKASRIVTISKNSKSEIAGHYGIDPSKISIIMPAVDRKLFRPQPKPVIDRIKGKYKINKPYILTVCTIEPRKNLIGTLSAFELLPEEIKKTHTLVLVGGKGWLSGEIEDKYETLCKKYNLIKTGYVPDSDLPALYSGASVFVFPSFYEGFGIPILEAMASGTPVITADNSSLPEVAGKAALYVKAEDTSGLAQTIEKVLLDQRLADSLRKKGFDQARKFSWEDSAQELLKLVKEVGAK